MDGHIVIYRRSDDLWDWRLVAANGETVSTSGGQGFSERNDAIEAAARVFGADYQIELQT